MDKELQSKLILNLLPHHPARIGVFGSFARGDNKKGKGDEADILSVLIEKYEDEH